MSGKGTSGNIIAALCSLFIPGLGQLLQGRWIKAIFMFVAAFMVNADKWFWNVPGMEFPVFLMIVAFIVLIRGGGDLSVDGKLSKEF